MQPTKPGAQMAAKQKYTTPRLIVHGSLEKITQSGTKNEKENGGHPSGKN